MTAAVYSFIYLLLSISHQHEKQPQTIANLQRVGGWTKYYFVLQNSLLMSYNSKDEYEKKLVSFKDVICLIPGISVLLPSLEPRFTIASNLNTFYTFVS